MSTLNSPGIVEIVSLLFFYKIGFGIKCWYIINQNPNLYMNLSACIYQHL